MSGDLSAAPTVTVIIAAYSSERWDDLRAAVQSVVTQNPPPLETIVAVDHNLDLLTRVLTELPSVVAVANNQSQGAGGARNSGALVARGDILAFLDDDAAAEAGWIEAISAVSRDPSVIGVGGPIRPNWLTGRPWWFPREFDWVVGCTFRGSPEKLTAVRNLIAANMSVRRSLFEELGGFRKDFGKVGTVSQPEETEFCIRAGQTWPERDWFFSPAVAVSHNVPGSRTSPRYYLRRCWLEGTGKADLAELVSDEDATSDERRYTLVFLPSGTLIYLLTALVDPRAYGRAAMLVAGFGFTLAGFLVRRVRRLTVRR